MIKNPTKKKLLAELEKNGNVTIACLKAGVNRATFYRWKQESNEFKEKSEQAETFGRENNCDIAEQSLMMKIKDKDLGAIKYLLGHNSPRYKGKETSNVVIVHKKELPKTDATDETNVSEELKALPPEKTLEWLNGVITDLNDGKASGQYYIADE